MKVLPSLLPLALVLAVLTGLVWWLLDRESAAAPWLVAAIVFAHGWVHLAFLLPAQGEAEDSPFDMSASWLIGQGPSVAVVRAVGTGVVVATFLAFLSAALATVGWLVPTAWWAGLVIAGAVGSTLLLIVFFSPLLLLGFLLNAGLVLLALQTAYDVPR